MLSIHYLDRRNQYTLKRCCIFVTDMEQDYPDFTTEDEMCSLTLILDDGCRLYVHKEVMRRF